MNMMVKLRVFFVSVSAWLLTACASTVTPSNEYLLMDVDLKIAQPQITPTLEIQLMPVSVSSYLAGNEIVLVSKQGAVHRSKSNLWAETLSAQLTRLTQQRLEKTLPNIRWFGDQRLPANAIAALSIEVDNFYADLEGIIHIAGRWQLISELGELTASNTFYVTDKLPSDGYTSMVQTLSSSWFNGVIHTMAMEVAQSLNSE